MRRCAFEGKIVDTSQGNVKRTPATIAAPSAPAGHQHHGIHRGIEMGRSKYTFLYHSARNRKFADSSPEGSGFELLVPRQIGNGFAALSETGPSARPVCMGNLFAPHRRSSRTYLK
jgi:hypothetical protein